MAYITISRGHPCAYDVDIYPVNTDEELTAAANAMAGWGIKETAIWVGEPDSPDAYIVSTLVWEG
jgi:hypothetical protein